ncbi:hypothetical protein KY342_01745 [Candidatus Woesearchaeota archaeon]|nr:hypothetical protein [Candidatus Woesearchaeota archaeon]
MKSVNILTRKLKFSGVSKSRRNLLTTRKMNFFGVSKSRKDLLTTKKKGQLTLFMIIGLVILMLFLAMFYLISSIKESRLEKEARQTTESILATTTIQFFVSDCLKDLVEEGLLIIGRQGGYFYENQPGYEFPIAPNVYFEEDNVSYLIHPREGFYNVWWPCSSVHALNEPAYCRFSTETTDPNDIYPFGFSDPVLPSLRADRFSIKSQLSKYIEKDIRECANFTLLEQNFPGYNFSGGEIEVDINFGRTVAVFVTFPITMQFQDYEPIIDIQKFKAEIPVRFLKIYNLVEKLITKEAYVLNSVLMNESIVLLEDSPEIRLTMIENGFEDIFIVNDSFSKIDGKNYIFQFARKNRPPVLNYISRSPSYLYDINDKGKDIYDYLVIPGVYGLNEIVASIDATDPDEDFVYYSTESDEPEFSLTDIAPLSTFVINDSFIGYHNVTVIATDQDESDKQTVRLLVDRPLKPNATFYNPYGNSFYSIEDPFFFNATISEESLDPFADYIYMWFEYGGTYELETEHPCIIIPTGEECSEAQINIEDITGYAELPGTVSLKADLYYTELSQKEFADFKITKKQCVPYRADSDPYPYHTTADPFMANHSCCLGDINNPETWKLADTNVVCHEDFICVGAVGLKKRIRQVHCSGDRGNICDGSPPRYTDSDMCGCNAAEGGSCDGVKAFGLKNGEGWCYGNEGCEEFCESAVVDTNRNTQLDQGDACGCGDFDSTYKCDENFDGIFNGDCTIIGSCTEVFG